MKLVVSKRSKGVTLHSSKRTSRAQQRRQRVWQGKEEFATATGWGIYSGCQSGREKTTTPAHHKTWRRC